MEEAERDLTTMGADAGEEPEDVGVMIEGVELLSNLERKAFALDVPCSSY